MLFRRKILGFIELNMMAALQHIGLRMPAEGREDQLIRADGTTAENRHAREVAERLVAEQIADGATGRAVQDQAETSVLRRVVRQDDHRAVKVRIQQPRMGNEQAARESGWRVVRIAHSTMIRGKCRVSSACGAGQSHQNDALVLWMGAQVQDGRRLRRAQRPTSNSQLPTPNSQSKQRFAFRCRHFDILHFSFFIPPLGVGRWALDVGR